MWNTGARLQCLSSGFTALSGCPMSYGQVRECVMDTDSLTEQTDVLVCVESACAVRLGPTAVSLYFAFNNSVENENKCIAGAV